MRRIVLIFGLIAGALLSAMMLITLPFQDQIGLFTLVTAGVMSRKRRAENAAVA
jgi:hypothetical protein